eukprot:1591726-Pleurochrysis_carterae.AAC.2
MASILTPNYGLYPIGDLGADRRAIDDARGAHPEAAYVVETGRLHSCYPSNKAIAPAPTAAQSATSRCPYFLSRTAEQSLCRPMRSFLETQQEFVLPTLACVVKTAKVSELNSF